MKRLEETGGTLYTYKKLYLSLSGKNKLELINLKKYYTNGGQREDMDGAALSAISRDRYMQEADQNVSHIR